MRCNFAGATLCCLLAALVVGGLTACGSGTRAGAGTTFERSDAAKFILTPRDLGAGYAISYDSGCGGFDTEEQSEQFTQFVFEARPTGCRNDINYIWGRVARTTVVPRAVQSRAAVFDSEADARRGMKLRGELLRFMVGLTPRDYTDVPDFGHDAVRFATGGYDMSPSAGVLWRNGNMLAVVFAGGEGMTPEQAAKVAVELARKQQLRIEHPLPAVTPEKMDWELPLDDPTIDVPVYWLGRRFEPGGGLPALMFARSDTGTPRGFLNFTAELDYGAQDDRETYGVKLWVFRPDQFETFEDGVLGRIVSRAPCAKTTKLDIPGGRAVIWGGFAKPTRPPCPNRPYDRYVAHVYLKGAVVTVNESWCIYPCGAPFRGTSDPYDTPRGLAALAKGLRVRQPRSG
ncbi:MAG TPA: hypothetical protein VK488_07805 [Gaiellaceae bacterium]|nr:hypothetical protein [Gaiellaceae bacterium]